MLVHLPLKPLSIGPCLIFIEAISYIVTNSYVSICKFTSKNSHSASYNILRSACVWIFHGEKGAQELKIWFCPDLETFN